ncbi:MAG: hypothetical protein KDD66_12370 [Bdellovibrionales bacterium]|nr:hypothetical protein [Bdellovibrionales bacterium]
MGNTHSAESKSSGFRESSVDDLRRVSQRNFKPTPYKQEEWEVVGERLENLDFIPMEIEVIPSGGTRVDVMFDDFGVQVPHESRSIWHNETLTNPIPADSEAPAPEIDEELIKRKVQEAYKKGKAEGLAEGLEQAKADVVENYNKLVERMQSLTADLNTKVNIVYSEVERHALEFSLQVARKILETTSEAKPEYIYEIIKRGISSLGSASAIRIRVSPQDLEFLEVVGLPEDMQSDELGVSYVADDSIKSGCVIETDFGETDLQLDAMWEQVAADLFEVYRK